MYLNQNGFKFCTQPEWKGTNYGANFDTAPDADNIVMEEPAGYYMVEVDLSEKTYKLTPITSIAIIGAATPGGWDAETPLTYNETERCWEVKGIELTAGECKFRSNHSWDDPNPNWGGTLDALVQKGDNINVAEAGTYDIKLYAWANGYAKCEMNKK